MCDYQFISSDHSPAYGKFYSPRYPSSYPKNIRCSYRFRARYKERIRIIFEEVALQKGDIRYWANVAIPHGTNGFHAVCPFCASPLSGSPGYVRLIFQDNVD